MRAADPRGAVRRGLEELEFDPDAVTGKIHLLAFGKAAPGMARGALEWIGPGRVTGERIALTHHENAREVESSPDLLVLGAGHPIPDAAGVEGAARIEEIARQAGDGDAVLVLVSGGGSALLVAPAEGLSLEDKMAATQALLACGANIEEMNTVRKHLSRLKGGGLARAIHPARGISLLLSDVIGDDVSTIASGPTVPDPTSFGDALEVFLTYGIEEQISARALDHLLEGARGERTETPGPEDGIFASSQTRIVGSNAVSLQAVAERARRELAGEAEVVVWRERVCGEAREEARALAHEVCARERDGAGPLLLLAGGETTVRVRGPGRGGRNQEFALAVALELEDELEGRDWAFLSGGTDGRDGPTEAAGGLVDATTIDRLRELGVDPEKGLERNDSNSALARADDLLVTGPTGTNVADLQLFYLA